MKITTLIEDTKKDDEFVNELGLSLLIETHGVKILLDTGGSGSFIANSKSLGIDLQDVEVVIISHAHADHGGGLYDLLQMNTTASVYMHKEAAGPYYGSIGARLPKAVNFFVHPFVSRSMRFTKYIGLDQEVLRKYKHRIWFVSKPIEIREEIFLLADIKKKHPLPEGNKFLLAYKNGKLQLDDFHHEIILAVKENDGIVVFTGCCHSGVLNIIEAVKAYFHNLPLKAVIGGFHLKLQPGKDNMAGRKENVEFIAHRISDEPIKKIYTGHCTGSEAYGILKEKLQDRIEPLYTGSCIEM